VDSRRYEFRIRGRLGDTLLATFQEFDAEVEPVETILRGTVADQAALHGILEQIQDLGSSSWRCGDSGCGANRSLAKLLEADSLFV
jgi:hypothetical protein